MTISLTDNNPRISYTVNAGATQTSFTVPFEFFDIADLNVYVDGTQKSATTHYTVSSGGSGSTGTIALTVTGASGGSTVVITRDIDLARTTDFPTSGSFNIAALNTELDKITAQFADRKDDVDRSLRLQDSDTAASMELPLKDARKGTVLGFNATTGVPEAGPTIADVSSLSAVTADIATLADIEDGTDATDAIQTVAGISSNVTTVAGISSNVTSVAGNASNINAVAGNATNINTVAGKESEITSVAAKASLLTSDFVSDLNTLAVTDVINDINTLATSDIVSDLNTLATSDIVSDLNTLATSDIVSDINTLATSDIVTDLNLLATSDFVSDLNTIATTTNVNNLATVAGAVSNVNTVAGISSDVTAVAGISSDVAAVEDIAANVTSVAGNASNINAAVSNASNINAVVSNASNINSVAGIAANVTTVAGIASNVTTVAGAASNVSTVAGAITNVNNVGGSIANVNTVATNISGVNSFAERYRVGSSDPSSSLDAGDLAYNTSDNALKYYTGSAWASITAGIGNIVEDSSPQLGGDLQSNGNDIVIADTDNIYVGTSNDGLKIHHSNNNSFIEDVGTGNFLITTNGNNIQLMKNQAEQMLVAKTDGSVELYYDNAKKFETSSSGVSVTGQVIATKGSTGTLATFTDGVATNFTFKTDGSSVGTFGTEAGSTQLAFMVANTEAARFDGSRNLLVGKTSSSTTTAGFETQSSGLTAIVRDSNPPLYVGRNSDDGDIVVLRKDGTTVGSIKAGNGDLLIGTGAVNLRFFDATPAVIPRTASDGTSSAVVDLGNVSNSFKDSYCQRVKGAAGHTGEVHFTGSHDVRFVTNGNERARFDSSGSLRIGQSSTNIPGVGNTTSGISLRGHIGDAFFSRSGGDAAYFNTNSAGSSVVTFSLSGTGKGNVAVSSSGATFNTTSDIRLKQDIEPLVATDKLMAMNPVSYAWKSDPDGPRSMGFIAQEMQEVMPEAVTTRNDDDAMMSMDYGRITPILVSALQDAHRKIEQLEQRIADMEAK